MKNVVLCVGYCDSHWGIRWCEATRLGLFLLGHMYPYFWLLYGDKIIQKYAPLLISFFLLRLLPVISFVLPPHS